MNILLLNAPAIWTGRKMAIYPLGLASIGTYILKKSDYSVDIIDLNLFYNHLDYLKRIFAIKRYDVVGIGFRNFHVLNISQLSYFIEVIKTIKNYSPHSKIVCGGNAFSLYSRALMKVIKEIDIGIFGEGEESFLEILNQPTHAVKGILYRSNDDIIFTGKRKPINMDDIYIPNRDWKYLNPQRYKMLNLQTKRGCPYKCIYCPNSELQGNIIRNKSLNTIIDELDYVLSFGNKNIFFVDTIFSLNENFIKICEYLLDRNIQWGAMFRPEGINREIVFLLKKTGCKYISFSVDSGSQEVINELETSINLENINYVASLFKGYPSHYISFSFTVGLPTEKVKDLIKTMKLAYKLKRMGMRFSIEPLTIFPHTELYYKYYEREKDIGLTFPLYNKFWTFFPKLLEGTVTLLKIYPSWY